MLLVNGHKVNVTVFPDGTSQVWKLSEELINSVRNNDMNIVWLFEGEAEFLQLIQLEFLILNIFKRECGENITIDKTLTIPYMPYARQDKEISNTSCFALELFIKIIECSKSVSTFDVHNPKPFMDRGFEFINEMPYDQIKSVILENDIDLIVYPDKGASERYNSFLLEKPFICLDKVRNQLTGEITGLSIKEEDKDKVKGKVLVVDDICDGGRTFIEAAKLLDAEKYLYISHGIFSKGVDCLYEAGYNAVYTVNDLSTKTFGKLTKKIKRII